MVNLFIIFSSRDIFSSYSPKRRSINKFAWNTVKGEYRAVGWFPNKCCRTKTKAQIKTNVISACTNQSSKQTSAEGVKVALALLLIKITEIVA